MYAAIFLLSQAEGLGSRKLISAPEAIEALDVDSAKKEGLQILSELAPHNKEVMKPLSIVELSEEMLSGIATCERIYLGNGDDDGDLEFADITDLRYWSSQPWWPN
jgi:hypothetical protein